MTLSRKELESIVCIACGLKYGEHARSPKAKKFSVRALMECMFRIQGSYVSDGIANAPEPYGMDIDGMTSEEASKEVMKEVCEEVIVTGTPRPSVYCKICDREYLDICYEHHNIPDSWELKYD